MTFPARGSGSLCLRKRFWDRHGVVYFDVETTLRHILLPNKLQRLSRGDPKNLGANTRIRILSRERSSRDLPGKRIGLTKRKNIIRRSKEQGQAFPLHQNFLLEISVVRLKTVLGYATNLFLLTGSKYLMGAQHAIQELKGKAALSHLGECVAVEGFFLWSSRQTGVLRNQAFQLLTGLYQVIKKHLSAYIW